MASEERRRRGCDHLVPYTRERALNEAFTREDESVARHCYGCGMWHVLLRREAGHDEV